MTEGAEARPPGAGLPELQRAILLTVLYSDLFDYPLTEHELYRYLVAACPARADFEQALAALDGRHLTRGDAFITLSGREHLVAIRQAREALARERWVQAGRYARWLRRVPFVRMVAVCGSQAAGNPREDADVDFFLISERGRLWTVQVLAMFLRRAASLASMRVCPNYLLALDSLAVEPQNLYGAREAAQAAPLWGADVHRRFLDANPWIRRMLPQMDDPAGRVDRLAPMAVPPLTALVERVLGGRLGDALDWLLYRALMAYYPLRLRGRGWRAEHVRRAYRRDRQEVMQGGYGPAVARAFRERVLACVGEPEASLELSRLFPGARVTPPEPDRLYARLFAERYGHGHD